MSFLFDSLIKCEYFSVEATDEARKLLEDNGYKEDVNWSEGIGEQLDVYDDGLFCLKPYGDGDDMIDIEVLKEHALKNGGKVDIKNGRFLKVYHYSHEEYEILSRMLKFYGYKFSSSWGLVIDRKNKTTKSHIDEGERVNYNTREKELEYRGYTHFSKFSLEDFAPIERETKKKFGEIELKLPEDVLGEIQANGETIPREFVSTLEKLHKKHGVELKVGCQELPLDEMFNWIKGNVKE